MVNIIVSDTSSWCLALENSILWHKLQCYYLFFLLHLLVYHSEHEACWRYSCLLQSDFQWLKHGEELCPSETWVSDMTSSMAEPDQVCCFHCPTSCTRCTCTPAPCSPQPRPSLRTRADRRSWPEAPVCWSSPGSSQLVPVCCSSSHQDMLRTDRNCRH